MNAAPLVSVVMPSFNQRPFIRQAIESVIGQSYRNIELLILDGGSTDGSIELIQEYSALITYWRSAKDGGQAQALREGFERARGEIFCWLNTDDVLMPNAIQQVAQWFLANPSCGLLSGGAYRVRADGTPLPIIPRAYTLGKRSSYRRMLFYGQDGVWQPATFWRADVYRATDGVDAALKYVMDRDLYLKMLRITKMGRLPLILAAFREHDQSKTTTMRETCLQENRLLNLKYGACKWGALPRLMVYGSYRFGSYYEKLYLMGLRAAGFVRLQNLCDVVYGCTVQSD